MRNLQIRVLLSALCIASLTASFSSVSGAPIRFDQVVQVVNVRPGNANTSAFARLVVANEYSFIISADDDDDKTKGQQTKPQDTRVITETKTDIVTDDVCDCEELVAAGGFPYWALLGLAAIPIAFIIIDDTPTPTPSPTSSTTPSPTPSQTPSHTPTPSPTPSPKTPPPTPSPTPPEPVPEPMTILLFGTGLASIGLAARRKFGKKAKRSEEKVEE